MLLMGLDPGTAAVQASVWEGQAVNDEQIIKQS